MKITVGEKEFTLKYNNKAIFNIEKEIGIPIFELMNLEDEKMAKELRKLHTAYTVVWAGITEPISFDEFSDMADLNSILSIQEEVGVLIAESFNTGNEVKKKETAEA